MTDLGAKSSAKGAGRKRIKDDASAEPRAVRNEGDKAEASEVPNFALLRAALAAAQASTPTAIAGRTPSAVPRPAEVLARIFGDGHSDPQQLVTLHGSFNPDANPNGSETEK